MVVKINEDCTACGICEDICPEVFELGDETAIVKINSVPEQFHDLCLDSAESCPMEAIVITE